MSAFAKSILTDLGWDQLSAALAGGNLDFVRMEAGDGYVTNGDEEMMKMERLVNKIMNIPITSYSDDGKGQLTLIGSLSSKDVTTGFYFRELGVIATVGTGPETLYAVSNSGDKADYIPDKNNQAVVIQNVEIVIKIDRATNVTVNLSLGANVTAQNIGPGTVGAGWFRDKINNILNFKRVVAGPMIAVTETSDTITIGQKQLNTSTTLWVKTGFNNVAPFFSTIQNAYNYLRQYVFAAGIGVYINVFPGVYYNPDFIWLDHVNASQIWIQGVNDNWGLDGDIYFGGVYVSGGGPWNWSVTYYNCNYVASLKVGSYLNCWFASGVGSHGNALVTGCFRITAISGNQVTVNIPYPMSWWPDLAGCVGYFSPLNTIFAVYGAGKYGWIISDHGIGGVRNICVLNAGAVVNYSSCPGIAIMGNGYFERCGVSGFRNTNGENGGWYVAYGYVTLRYCTSSNNSTGIVSTGGAQVCTFHGGYTHNGIMGIWCQGGTALSIQGTTFIGGCGFHYRGAGVLVACNSTFVCQGSWITPGQYSTGNWWIVWNYFEGLVVSNQSQMIQSTINDGILSMHNGISGQGAYDAVAGAQSWINAISIWGTRVFNIPVNKLSWDGSYIAA